MSHLITILGNIIDNAFDAVSEREEKSVSFFVTDIGHDIVFEVIDSGIGIPEEKSRPFFKKDFQRKEQIVVTD